MPAYAFIYRIMATASLVAVAGAASATALQELPKGAHSGECFSRTTSAPTYRVDHIPVAQPPLISWREIPAVYKNIDRQILVNPGRLDHETIPAVIGHRTRWIEHPGADRTIDTPPVYRWIEKRVLISPAHLVWKPGAAPRGYGGGYGEGISVQPTGEIMCRVLVPARYEIRRLRVIVATGKTCVVKGPSTHERVVETFVVTPARIVDHPVAPIYRTVSERVLVTPARRERIETPRPPRYLDKKVEVAPGQTGWIRIACKAPSPPRYRSQPAAVYGAPAPRPHGGQCHTHTVCEDVPTVPYAQPRPGGYGQPEYHAPDSGQGYGVSRSE